MDPSLRDYFDQHLEAVLGELPQSIHRLLDDVPLHVEDYPPQSLLNEMGIRGRRNLCGLHSGVPLTERSVYDTGRLPNVVTIYREGILEMSCHQDGNIDQDELRRQIRITLLHELGHYHGLDEDDLEELGYG